MTISWCLTISRCVLSAVLLSLGVYRVLSDYLWVCVECCLTNSRCVLSAVWLSLDNCIPWWLYAKIAHYTEYSKDVKGLKTLFGSFYSIFLHWFQTYKSCFPKVYHYPVMYSNVLYFKPPLIFQKWRLWMLGMLYWLIHRILSLLAAGKPEYEIMQTAWRERNPGARWSFIKSISRYLSSCLYLDICPTSQSSCLYLSS